MTGTTLKKLAKMIIKINKGTNEKYENQKKKKE